MAAPMGFAAAFHPRPVRQPSGLAFPAADDSYPGKDDVADYLHNYAAEIELPIRAEHTRHHTTEEHRQWLLSAPISAARRCGRPGRGCHRPVRGAVDSRAAGPAGPGRWTQLHSSEYRRPGELPAGAGARGRRREFRLSDRPRTGRRPRGGIVRRRAEPGTAAATAGPRPVVVGRRGLGLDRVTVGLPPRPTTRRPGSGLRRRPARFASDHGVRIELRLTRAAGRTVTFENGTTAEPDAVVWATGYRAITRGSKCRGRPMAGPATSRSGVLPRRPACTRWVCPGSTPGVRAAGLGRADAAFVADQVARRPARLITLSPSP